ncbi:MAG: patatin-like phospholipase family protein [Chromatiaceae bacterium]|nr:patatin-like phospholipase family protein [Gammaproteobacteria bacterium]MCP5300894.1 patatin-like phospholipase family protein [Chromatiaceae bacterium]MCP5421633.1 patatin-like phospholipase family protein [Chromatiaceae bacterium]
MQKQLRERMQTAGPKKILACDGGGILGLMSVEILAAIEAQLRESTGNPDLVLADWFDFTCGTSTGAIIAACISCGMSTDQIRTFYVDSGEQMFDKASILQRLRYSYNDEPLAQKLQHELDTALGYPAPGGRRKPKATLGDEGLRTLLMMVLRNHTTDSPWPISNNPFGKYNQAERPDCNLRLPLWQLVRASTAAPTFFPPEIVTLGEGTEKPYSFVFVDGGVTTYNNPACLAYQMATAAPYGINWETGVDKMLIVSVGTGRAANARPNLTEGDLWLLDHAKNIPSALMNAASDGWDMSCRIIGECRFGEPIDREVGDLVVRKSDWGKDPKRHFAYVRYNPDVTAEGLRKLGLAKISAEAMSKMDSTDHIADIQRVGTVYAGKYVDSAKYFRGF